MKKTLIAICFLFCLSAKADCDTMSAFQVIRLLYSSTNVTTSAWVQLAASLPSVTRCMTIFDSSGQTMVLGLGASGHETGQPWYIFPGGVGGTPVTWAIGSRLSIEAVSGTASSGEISINLYQ